MSKFFGLTFLSLLIIFSNHSSAQYEYIERIISYDSDITINEDASMVVIERIKVYAGGKKYKEASIVTFQQTTKMNMVIKLL
jgi:hypothetical protein